MYSPETDVQVGKQNAEVLKKRLQHDRAQELELGLAAVVAIAGTIAFVGIIIPHTIRLLVGRSYRVVVPLSVLFGAAFLVLADTAARTVAAPAELPIGVITAFVGAPFFIVVMRSARASAL